jgi:Subtilase family/Bacterial Ig-like domain (group 3)
MSLSFSGGNTALDTAVNNSIAAGVTYLTSAGNFNVDACTVSPADVPAAITVGNIDPSNDTRYSTSDFGTCVDLFAPGVNIVSAGSANDTATSTYTGTSQASPHVAGVAAVYLQNHTTATPADVWAAIHHADDIATTSGWGGIINAGTGSPNELLHWGSLNDGFNDGDPHLTTVEGIHYDFQSAGEFVSLRDGGSMEIQTRQTAISTTFTPGPDSYDGLATCVSLNSAVAARVGDRRVTYEPNLNGVPDPSGLQLRVDGELVALGASGLDLGDGGRVVKTSAGGIEIDFPDETALVVTPGWWSSQKKWYLNADVFHSPAEEGLLGVIPPKSWIPALPDGGSMGPMPGPLHDRYVALYQKFADAWRVTDKTSLFDYAPGTSASTFTVRTWPPEHGPCVIPQTEPAQPATREVALRACGPVTDETAKKNCVFDVMATGDTGFAKTYILSQRMRIGRTRITVADDENPTQIGEWVTFTASVIALGGQGHPDGTVQFTLDGARAGGPIKVDSKGRATWETPRLKVGTHHVAASYTPSGGSVFLNSTSSEMLHSVKRCLCGK